MELGIRLVDGKNDDKGPVGSYVGTSETVGEMMNSSSSEVIRLTSIGNMASSVPLISISVVFKNRS